MIKKIFSFAFSVILLCLMLALPSFADNQKKAVYDLKNMLTDAEKTEIDACAREYSAQTGCNFYIVTAGSNSYFGDHFVRDYLDGVEGNTVILIIADNYERNYNMYTYGKPDRRISDSEVDEILDTPEIYYNIKDASNYGVACTTFIKMSAQACKAQIGLTILIGVLVALAVAGIVIGCIVASYKRKSRSEKYPLNQFANLKLTECQDIFVGTVITKRIISTGSSGHRTGRGSRGGGGGGGHRGGR